MTTPRPSPWNRILTPLTTLLALAAAGISGCAALPAATLELPPALASVAPETVAGVGGGRSGRFEVDGLRGRFERGADRLGLWGARLTLDQVRLTLEAEHADGRRTRLACRGRQGEAAIGVVALPLKAWTVECQDPTPADARGDPAAAAALTLVGSTAAVGTRDQRRGSWHRGVSSYELRSLHRWRGAAWPSTAPVGYVLQQGGEVLGAIELNGSPRLWRVADAAGAGPTARRDDTALALIAAALLWDPATQ